jgi:hypothetical protein
VKRGEERGRREATENLLAHLPDNLYTFGFLKRHCFQGSDGGAKGAEHRAYDNLGEEKLWPAV